MTRKYTHGFPDFRIICVESQCRRNLISALEFFRFDKQKIKKMSNTAERWSIGLGMENKDDPLSPSGSHVDTQESDLEIEQIVKVPKKKILGTKKRKERSGDSVGDTRHAKKPVIITDEQPEEIHDMQNRISIGTLTSSDDDDEEEDRTETFMQNAVFVNTPPQTMSNITDNIQVPVVDHILSLPQAIDIFIRKDVLESITNSLHADLIQSPIYDASKMYKVTSFLYEEIGFRLVSNAFCAYLHSKSEFDNILSLKAVLNDSFMDTLFENIKDKVLIKLKEDQHVSNDDTFVKMIIDMFILQFK